jgi:glycosyltransferase involved in cell wall biosynthesis
MSHDAGLGSDPRDPRPLISIVIPMMNEESVLAEFRSQVVKVADGISDARFEFVCVDDGSSDGTLRRLLSIRAEDDRFKVIELSRNFGKEAALSAGLAHARGDAVIPMDVDLQDPPSLIPVMIAKWREGYDVVLARRVDRSRDAAAKRLSAAAFYWVHNRMSRVQIPENVGDFRLIDRAVVEALRLVPESQRFMKGIFAWLGYRTCTLDYERSARAMGHTKFSAWRLWNLAIDGITGFSTAPLRLWTYLGGLGAAASLLYAAFVVVNRLWRGVDVPGYASLIVVVLFMGSLQLVSVGILGEYLGRTFLESKRRPTYIVRRTYQEP